ncbi:MAG: redox-sensing transcriptional repressor Rex [Planctomycetia bacterium]|nr:redox-sensing transcriptional repressor Rex [Planctomycetia bacterium]
MSTNGDRAFPTPSVRRLPIYLSLLRRLYRDGLESVSSTKIADELGLTGIQVRKDLSMTGIVGRPKVGHSISELIEHIEGFLGWDKRRQAFLVGAGHLGAALLGYKGFAQENLDIIASFDTSPEKIGKVILGRMTYDLAEFVAMTKKHHVQMAILTVPASCAQDVTNLMVDAGIIGIWNFAPVQLSAPPHIIIENVSLSSSLAILSQKLTQREAQTRGKSEEKS